MNKTCNHILAQSDNGKRCIKCGYLEKPSDDDIKKALIAREERYKNTGWKIITV